MLETFRRSEVVNRPSVARAVLPLSLIQLVSHPFVQQSSKYVYIQSARARDLKFVTIFMTTWLLRETCHMSCVTSQVLGVTCHMSHVM